MRRKFLSWITSEVAPLQESHPSAVLAAAASAMKIEDLMLAKFGAMDVERPEDLDGWGECEALFKHLTSPHAGLGAVLVKLYLDFLWWSWQNFDSLVSWHRGNHFP